MSAHFKRGKRASEPTEKPRSTRPPGRPDRAPLTLQRALGNQAMQQLDLARKSPGDAAGACEHAPRGDGQAEVASPETAAPALIGPVGQPPPAALRRSVEQVTGRSLGDVLVRTDAAAVRRVTRLGVPAVTSGRQVLGRSERLLGSSVHARGALAHELVHAAQQGSSGNPFGDPLLRVPAVESQAQRLAVAALQGVATPPEPILRAPTPALLPQDEEDPDEVVDRLSTEPLPDVVGDPQLGAFAGGAASDPFASWRIEDDSSLAVITEDDELFVLPGAGLLRVPPPHLAQADLQTVRQTGDAGPFMQIPSTGASGSRLFRAGPRAVLMVDAGGSRRGLNPVVYLSQLFAALNQLNSDGRIRRVDLLHRHGDHFNRLPDVVQQAGISPGSVFFPAEFQTAGANRDYDRMMREMRSVFGAGWSPQAASLRAVSSELVMGRFRFGTLEVQDVALRSSLRRLAREADRGSLLRRVTRTTDGASMVILGDLRGSDLNDLRTHMEAHRAGSWNRFFAGAQQISGFSHHAGAMTAGDVEGIMRLLDATLLQTGRLQAVVQTNTGEHARARADTLELLQRLGVELVYTDMPTGSQPTSSAGATRDRTRTTGPDARAPAPITSAFTQGAERLHQLELARQTYLRWRPMAEAQGADAVARYERELQEITASMQTLRDALRASAEAMVRVRTSGSQTPQGGRDYSGSTQGARFQASLQAIPNTTPAETRLRGEGFRQLERLRSIPAEQVSDRVAVYRALVLGEYSDRAFRYMARQIEPGRLNELLTGPRGGPTAREVAFRRVRAEFHFRQSVLPSGVSLRGIRGVRGGAFRGAGWLALLAEAVNLGAEVHRTVAIGEQTAHRQNVVPFLRRIMFWQNLGVNPRMAAVDSGIVSSTIVRDPDEIAAGLREDRFAYVLMEHSEAEPVFTDAELLRLVAYLVHQVRNYDEYATLFIDSGQDAIRHVPAADSDNWDSHRWEIRVGHFEESGLDHIVERWVELPRLTELLQAWTRRLIANTTEALRQQSEGQGPEENDAESLVGGLSVARDRVQGTARLRAPGTPTTVVEVRNQITGGGASVPDHRRFELRTVQWWSPPTFFVYESNRSGKVLVGGADHNTFAVLRRLEARRFQLNIGQQGTFTSEHFAPNTRGLVFIDAVLLDVQGRSDD